MPRTTVSSLARSEPSGGLGAPISAHLPLRGGSGSGQPPPISISSLTAPVTEVTPATASSLTVDSRGSKRADLVSIIDTRIRKGLDLGATLEAQQPPPRTDICLNKGLATHSSAEPCND